MDFTGGDMKLLPKLMEFNGDKSGWNEEIAEKQQYIDDYMGRHLCTIFHKAIYLCQKWRIAYEFDNQCSKSNKKL